MQVSVSQSVLLRMGSLFLRHWLPLILWFLVRIRLTQGRSPSHKVGDARYKQQLDGPLNPLLVNNFPYSTKKRVDKQGIDSRAAACLPAKS